MLVQQSQNIQNKHKIYYVLYIINEYINKLKMQYHLQSLRKYLGVNLTKYLQDLYAKNYTSQ